MEVTEIARMATSRELTEAFPQKGVQETNLLLAHPPPPTHTSPLFSCPTLRLH